MNEVPGAAIQADEESRDFDRIQREGESCYPYKNDGHVGNMLIKKVVDRNLEEYLSTLDLELKDLSNKKILDVGAGVARFVAEATKKGIDVVALDPMYLYDRGRMALADTTSSNHIGDSRNPEDKPKYLQVIASEAESVPMENESFDIIINMFSAYYYCKNPDNLERIFREQIRLLKPGGMIFITPVEVSGGNRFSFLAEIPAGPYPAELFLDSNTEEGQAPGIISKFKDLVEGIKSASYKIEVQNTAGMGYWTLKITKPA